MSGNGSATGSVTPICHSFKMHLLSTYYVLLTISLGHTVNNTGQCPCYHESSILERITDNNQRKKLQVVMKVVEEVNLGKAMESDYRVGRNSR